MEAGRTYGYVRVSIKEQNESSLKRNARNCLNRYEKLGCKMKYRSEASQVKLALTIGHL